MENRIDFVMAPEVKETILQSIKAAKTAMPFLIKLSKSERSSLQTIDDGRKPFVQKSIDFAKSNSDLDPGSGLVEASSKDLELFSFLTILQNELLQLTESVRDTRQLAGSEAYEVARIIYMKSKMNVKMGIPGSQAMVDELSKIFKQNGTPASATGGK